MSKKQWLVLLMLFLLYLLLGASIFYHIESPLEVEQVEEAKLNRIEINALLHEHYISEGTHDQHEILQKLSDYCGKPLYNYTEGEEDQYKWDFYNSFYFAYTVVSTIGYGNLAPTNMLGRILMIFYALIGIPINGILLTQLGEYFGHVFVKAHKKYKAYKGSQPESPSKRLVHLESSQAGLTAQIFMYLAPGFVMFIFFPSFLFSYWEGWSYDESVYYAFVTLTTIGFGDYVAGQDNAKGSGIFWIMYKVFLISWIVFGLGYIVMIMGFIARGMQSKKITRLEHRLAVNLKHTQSKIWNGFSSEVDYLRRVFNELYLMRLKPVYNDEYETEDVPITFTRCHSFPDLRELHYSGFDKSAFEIPRRRANSEVIQPIERDATRVASENDLDRLGKTATYASHAMVQPGELLASLVNVLGYMPSPPPDEFEPGSKDDEQSGLRGVQGFSDREILANEQSWRGSGWKIGGDRLPVPKIRQRTFSEARYPKENLFRDNDNEYTWSGPTAAGKLKELVNARRKSSASAPKDPKSRIPSFSFASVPKNIRPKWLDAFVNKKSGEQSRDEPSQEDLESDHENYFSHTQNTRPLRPAERISNSPNYHTYTGGSLPHAPDGNLLEQTSLADFLRALTALHSRVGAVPDEFVPRPQRKLGTASLTPPQLPNLMTLFSPPSGYATPSRSHQNTFTSAQQTPRRYSQVVSQGNSGTSTPSYPRKGSLKPNMLPRRFSLRRVITPSGTPPHDTPPYTPTERNDPPPYSADVFAFESSKEPLVSAEIGPARDVPTHPPTGPPSSPKPMGRPLPRWKGGMLQRQVTELNLQRRVRAFSLSDVNNVRNDRPTSHQTSPLALPQSNQSSKPSDNANDTRIVNDSRQSIAHVGTSNSPVHSTPMDLAPNLSSNSTTTSNLLSMNPMLPKTQIPYHHPGMTALQKRLETRVPRVGLNETPLDPSLQPYPQAVNPFISNLLSGAAKIDGALDNPNKIHPPFAQKTGERHSELESVVVVKPSNEPSHSDSENALQGVRVIDAAATISPDTIEHSTEYETARGGKEGVLPSEKNVSGVAGNESLLSGGETITETIFGRTTPSLRSSVPGSRIALTKRKLSTISQHSGQSETSSRKISTMSQQSSDSAPDSRKTSTMSQQDIESGSRKSSTAISPSDKPRVSVESYKSIGEFTVEKPATDPFEQYRNTVEGKTDKNREERDERR